MIINIRHIIAMKLPNAMSWNQSVVAAPPSSARKRGGPDPRKISDVEATDDVACKALDEAIEDHDRDYGGCLFFEGIRILMNH
jgi:hypothetical protein